MSNEIRNKIISLQKTINAFVQSPEVKAFIQQGQENLGKISNQLNPANLDPKAKEILDGIIRFHKEHGVPLDGEDPAQKK